MGLLFVARFYFVVFFSLLDTLFLRELHSLTVILGCLEKSAPLLIERIGHRYTMFILCMISFAGIIVEGTSDLVVQFVLGRIIVYYRFVFSEKPTRLRSNN